MNMFDMKDLLFLSPLAGAAFLAIIDSWLQPLFKKTDKWFD